LEDELLIVHEPEQTVVELPISRRKRELKVILQGTADAMHEGQREAFSRKGEDLLQFVDECELSMVGL